MSDDLEGRGGRFSYSPLGDDDEGKPLKLERESQNDIRIMCDYGAGLPVWNAGGHITHSIPELSAHLGVSAELLELLQIEQERWERFEDSDDWSTEDIETHRELAARFAAELKPPFRLVDAMF